MYKKEISEKENMLLVLGGEKPAWLPHYFTACATAGYNCLARTRDADGYDVDAYGVRFTRTIDGPIPLNTQTRDFELKDIRDWKSVIPKIDFNLVNWEEEGAIARSKVPEGKIINFSGGVLWEQVHYMMGFENALLAVMEEPEALSECLMALSNFYVDALRRIFPHLKPEIVMLMDHVANAAGLLMSPEQYREIIKPAQKNFYDAVKELGAVAEMHVDGNVEAILGDYHEMGIQMIQPFQVFNDIEAAKVRYGFVACGGWNAIGPGNQPNATEEEVRASVRLAMDTYGPTGRYIFFESGATPRFPKIPEWIADEANSYGSEFYQKGQTV